MRASTRPRFNDQRVMRATAVALVLALIFTVPAVTVAVGILAIDVARGPRAATDLVLWAAAGANWWVWWLLHGAVNYPRE